MESVYGITRASFIYHQSMYLLIREKLGRAADEPDPAWPQMVHGDGEFHRYLTSQGVDINAFVNASQEWLAHFGGDPSGQAMADFQAEVHQLRTMRDARPTGAEFEETSRSAQLTRQRSGQDPNAIHGMTKETLAEVLSKYTELKAKFGEAQAEQEFSNYLGSRGLSPYQWATANNAWHARFKADPTGRTEAEFHMLLAQASQKAHFGDVRDMSQDTEEGITLDQYAQIVVAISRQGADANAIVQQFGLQDVAHWQRANAAWTAKMGADTTHKLTMQYGQLYSKHAGPQFQAEMVQQTADILAEANKPRDAVREPEVELTPALCLQKMQSPRRNERWKYSYLYANMADLGNVPDKAQAIRTVTPILIDKIESHDEHTTSDAEGAVRQLWDLEVRNGDIPSAIGRCLNRAREKLRTLQAAFAPIQNQAVPERVTLQSQIQDFTSLVETMQEYSEKDWSPAGDAPGYAQPGMGARPGSGGQAGVAAPAAFGAPVGFPQMPKVGSGFPKWPLAPVILVVVGGGIAAMKLRSHSATANRALTSASASASATTAAATASTAADAKTPATGAAGTASGKAKVTAPSPKKHK